MGWVENKFTNELVYMNGIAGLWNMMRDSIGVAVQEFNKRTSGAGNTLIRKDCRAMGQYCLRVERTQPAPSSVEIFLDEEDKSLKVSLQVEPQKVTRVCGYRLTADRSGLEFFETVDGVDSQLSAETACEKALGDFLFTPFPRMFAGPEGRIVTR